MRSGRPAPEFESVSVGEPYIHKVSEPFLRDAIVGEPIVPVKVVFTEKISGSKSWDYRFYKNANGEWTNSASVSDYYKK